MTKKIITRNKYLDRIAKFQDKNIIKVITGQRRVGKSFVLKNIISDLKKNKKVGSGNIIYINKEDLKFDQIATYIDLDTYIKQALKQADKRKKVYLLIDEIQEIVSFEKTIRSYALKTQFDIYITGSNSKVISSELSTFLSGRYIEINILSLDYNEFLVFSGQPANQSSLNKYIKYGGLPFLHQLKLEDDLAYTYLKNVYHTILLTDVIKKFEIRNVQLLENLVVFLCNNVGFEFSANSIAKYFKSEGLNVTTSVLINYLQALVASYFVHEVKKYDLKGKRIFKQNAKYYLNDTGITNSIVKFNETSINQLIENLVYLHLKSNEYDVYTGILGDKEIDFVAIKNNKITYIQVSLTIQTQKTKDREFGNLLKIKDAYPKLVVTMDNSTTDYQGVAHLKLIDFLKTFK